MKKFLIIPILLISFVSIGQDVLTGSELPTIVQNDTVIIYGEAWVQSSRSEVHQRAEQKSCEKRLKRVHKVLNSKILVMHQIDSLLLRIEDIETQRDSLKMAFDNMTLYEVSEAQIQLNKYAKQITDSNYDLWVYKTRLKKIKKKLFLLYTVIVLEGVLIVLLI
ncbi:MAG: hypothetical protein S4CHLAM20_04320 [Chlamydiia bacterium]|nr:hypothetical protein [Chlamydiia bacterium]